MDQQERQNPNSPQRPEEDEIDLADLVAVLFRHRYLIVVITLLAILAATAYTWLQPKQYKVTTFVEIGQTLVDGAYKNIEPPQAIKNRYQASALSLARNFPGEGKDGGLRFSPKNDLTVNAPDSGNILQVELKTPRPSSAEQYLDRLNKKLIQAHSRIFSQEKEKIKNQISRLNLQIEQIDNQIAAKKRKFNIKKIAKKNQTTQIKGKIQNLRDQRDTLGEQLSLLKQEQKDLQDRIKKTQNRYRQLTDSKKAANHQASSQNAIGLMLFSNEIFQVQKYLEDIRNRLLFKIPKQRANFQEKLKALGTRIQNQKADLDQAKTELKQLDAELKSSIDDLEAKKKEKRLQIQTFNKQLDNMIVTRVTAKPAFSSNAIAPNLKLNLALGLVLGAFFSIFLAFLREFWVANRGRITRKSEEGG